MSKIVKIELTPVFVPFRQEVLELMKEGEGGLGMAIASEEEWNGGDFVICKMFDDEGHHGLGEAFVWLPETGVSPEQIIDIIQQSLSQYVLGQSPFDVEKIRQRMNINVNRSDVAKGLIDIACYDLMGKITNRPAHDFMGGKCKDELPLCALIPLMPIEQMIEFSQKFYAEGMRTFRLKLGLGVDKDKAIISKFREVMGDQVRLRVDYNQAYSPTMAVRAILAIEPFGIDFAEQPVRADNYAGMAYVQARVNVPVMAHEGCFSLQDINTLINMKGINTIGMNAERPGGVTNMLHAISYAQMEGIGCVLHNQPLGIGAAMQIHVATARYHDLGHDIELFGDIMLEDDLITTPITYENGTVTVPTAPGWGVELDELALKKYATSATVIIE